MTAVFPDTSEEVADGATQAARTRDQQRRRTQLKQAETGPAGGKSVSVKRPPGAGGRVIKTHGAAAVTPRASSERPRLPAARRASVETGTCRQQDSGRQVPATDPASRRKSACAIQGRATSMSQHGNPTKQAVGSSEWSDSASPIEPAHPPGCDKHLSADSWHPESTTGSSSEQPSSQHAQSPGPYSSEA